MGIEICQNSAIDDWDKAQRLADQFNLRALHKRLHQFARRYYPAIRHFPVQYHWSIIQAEYAADIIVFRQACLQDIYGTLTRTAIHAVKADNIAPFLGCKLILLRMM
jgi:hypothetical protein